jgi:excisionase family DNA binding protein
VTGLLTVKQAAEWLQISERTLREHVVAQDLPAIPVGQGRVSRRLRFDPADLAAFAERRKAELRGGLNACRSTATAKRRISTTTSNTKVVGFAVLREKFRSRQPSE